MAQLFPKRLRKESPPDSPNYVSDSSHSETDVVWPSKQRKKFSEFKQMVEDKNFIIGSDVVEVHIKTLPNTETFPLPQCTNCKLVMEESSILSSASNINWPLISTSTFNIHSVDRRFFQLFTSYRSALNVGCFNGVAKKVTESLISLVRRETLCSDHDILLNVYSPSKSKEPGGIDSRIYPVDKHSKDNVCNGSETIVGCPDVAVVDDSVYHFIALTEHKRSESWRPGIELSSDDSHIGQLLQYMLGVHLQELDKNKGKRVLPILGLYMDGLVVRSVVSDVTSVRGHSYKVTMYMGEKFNDLNQGVIHSIAVLHKFLSMER